MLTIGPYSLSSPFVLAPMAGLTDLPFRDVCRAYGAALGVGEMTASDPALWDTAKSSTRWVCEGETGFKVVQLVGSDPSLMAQAALYAQTKGADWIDLNIGCPAKKVLKKACGSALMREPETIRAILRAVKEAVSIPVTLKMRTGWSESEKNAVAIARMAESEGVALLTVHGRTREQGFKGEAEYDTIREVKAAVSIPVLANGDITSAQKALDVLNYTHADGVMVGRGALGRPWLFSEMLAAWKGEPMPHFTREERVRAAIDHATKHFTFYSSEKGVRLFRKHLTYYFQDEPMLLKPLLAATTQEDVLDLLQRKSYE